MKKHTKKLIAPIVITAVLVLYYLAFIVFSIFVSIPLPAKILCWLIPALLIGVCIYVLRERIKEIRSGEEDDLGKY